MACCSAFVRARKIQNSLPSGSAMTTHVTPLPWPISTRVAPRDSSRATSASWSTGRKSRCRRFLMALDSGTRRNNMSGRTPNSGLPGAGCSAISSSSPSSAILQPNASAQNCAVTKGDVESMEMFSIRNVMPPLCRYKKALTRARVRNSRTIVVGEAALVEGLGYGLHQKAHT